MPPERKKIRKLRTGALVRSATLARLGLSAGVKAAGSALASLVESESAAKLRQKAHWLSQAADLVGELGELKGSLMKAGQMLSVYGEHFLPEEVSRVFRSLQSESTPVVFSEMEKVLSRSLGKEKLARLEIEEEPCGAASLGQVHRARIRETGELLAVKIQYPGVDRAIDSDLKVLRRMLSLADLLPKIPATDELFEEVRSMLRREVNYERELSSLVEFRERIGSDPRYILPKPYPEFSGKRVLSMSFESGVSLGSQEIDSLSQERRNSLAIAALDLYFRELFVWRQVQTDPHFGNYRVRLSLSKDGDALILYDFGAVREISESFIKKYKRILNGTFRNDRKDFELAAIELGVLEESDPAELKEIFWNLCRLIIEPFLPPQPYEWKNSVLPKKISELGWHMVRAFPLRSPPRELVFLDRKMAGMFTLLARLGAKIDGRSLLESYLK